ncbi:MAG: YjbH domain-containing protein [Ignavibacteriaceae bacterium]|nr:YjbH domain-containing protein [Ignavibacteriaceae bacterium]
MKNLLSVFLTLFCLAPNLFSQGTAGENANYQYRFLIDMPTAGVLDKGLVSIGTDYLPYGVVIGKLEVGVFEDVSFGISYGGVNVIGAGNPDWYKLPAVDLRFRLFKETLFMPTITLGFNSQGKGTFSESAGRYAIKSPGFFGAVSKNFALYGYLSLHGSASYSLETRDADNFINISGGFEKTLSENFSIVGEYDFAFNDNQSEVFGKGNGYLNLGIRWTLGEGFTFGFDLRDLLNNKKINPSTADRAIRIEFIRNI